LCLDKTGTLTTNSIQLDAVYPVGDSLNSDEAEVRRILGDYAASTAGGNQTTAAIQKGLPGQPRPLREEVPFSSDRKWSALTFDDPLLSGIYVLGAPEVLQMRLRPGVDLGSKVDEWAREGLRVVLFAYYPGVLSLYDEEGEPRLPAELLPLYLLSFRDELRPEAQATLQHFVELGIEPKIISGDNPQTVAALARQVGFAEDTRTISGLELEAMGEARLSEVATETTIFGRITPQQKQELVHLFREQGCYVAMIGDGVNDVLSLKQAQVGIAMQSGSQAARGVADIVLLEDSFAALPTAFREGQRIIRGMEDVVRLLLTRTIYVLLLVVASQLVGVPFPLTPKHNSILALLTVGIPILAIAAWARPGTLSERGTARRGVLRATGHFVFPAAFTVSVVAVAIYLAYLETTGSLDVAHSALTTAMVLCGLTLIPFVEPPTKWWVGGDLLSGDWRPTLLALGMLGLYGVVLAVPPLRGFFELTLLRGWDYLLIGGIVAAWALLLRVIWRTRLFERLLDLS
jgi:cation-transporting ATPase E